MVQYYMENKFLAVNERQMDTELIFGKWLRKRRRTLDFTQKELAQRVGCAVSTIRKFESGERRPSKVLAIRLAECLNIAPAEIDGFIAFARAKPFLDAVSPPTMDHVSPLPQTTLPSLSPLTSFIGRKQELARITHLLLDEADCRLLTLIGAGGIGKTRLAIKAVEQLQDNFADGIYIVPLVGVSGAEFLVPTIANTLHCSFSGGVDPKIQLLNYLQAKEMLLVLDNFEHLIDSSSVSTEGIGAIDLLLEILKMTAKVKLLVTSRERLNLQVEWLISLAGLSFPVDRADPVSGRLRGS